VVVLVLLAAFAAYHWDLGVRWGIAATSPTSRPAPTLSLPSLRPAAMVASPTPSSPASGAAVRRALAGPVADRALGARVAVAVADASDGRVVYSSGPATVVPASTTKLLTTSAALLSLGAQRRFTTSVVGLGHRVTLVGGGDPLLMARPVRGSYPTPATLAALARKTATALRAEGVTRIRLGFDAGLFKGPAVDPQWPRTYVTGGVVSPISALWVDEGRVRRGSAQRSPDPARAAAQAFAGMLARAGIAVRGAPPAGAAPVAASLLAKVESAPLSEIVEHTLEASDNEAAEVLARQVAIAEHEPASFAGAVTAVRRVLGSLGVDTAGDTLYDGSGLSRRDRLRPVTLLAVLHTAATNPSIGAVLTGLPVAGFTGSLAYRFQSAKPVGLGVVRAKTGTLTGVSGLAGTVTTSDGVVLDFVAVADRIAVPRTLAARASLDRIAASLAACRCAG